MPSESPSPLLLKFMVHAYGSYASLMRFAGPHGESHAEPGLGGKLLYVGEPDENRRSLIAAANIAGAATLAASAQHTVLRQAQRNGLIDFLVNSLDEAVRVLKNEIRKRQPVAVAVSVATQSIEAEMLERGLQPDLLPMAEPATLPSDSFSAFAVKGAQHLQPIESFCGRGLHIWQIPSEYVHRPAAFEALLLEHVLAGDDLNRRWTRLSPRYLGVEARRLRSLACDDAVLSKLVERLGPPLHAAAI